MKKVKGKKKFDFFGSDRIRTSDRQNQGSVGQKDAILVL